MMKGLANKISEYFLGTETRKFYDWQIATVEEFAMDEDYGLAANLREVKTVALLFGKYLPNVGDILSTGAFVTYLATDNPRTLLWSIFGFIGSELGRGIIGRRDKSSQKLYGRCADLTKLSFRATSASERLARGIGKEAQSGREDTDSLDSDGWLDL